MARTQTYSFLDIAAAIVGPGGSFPVGAGAGVAEEGIEITQSQPMNTMMMGSDGAGQHSLSGDKSGQITLRLLKTSPVNGQLMAMANFQRTGGATHGLNTLTITDTNRQDVVTAQQVAFNKIPTLTYAKEAGVNEWIFDAVVIDYLLA